MVTARKPLVYRGSIEICAAIGVEMSELPFCIKELSLPVFKIKGQGQWLAVEADLEKWLGEQRDHFIVSASGEHD